MRSIIEWLLLVPVVLGSLYSVLTLLTVIRFRLRRLPPARSSWPPVSLLKPVYGIEKELEANLRTACEQDYPEYEVVFSLQRQDDPALPLLRKLREEFGGNRVQVVVDQRRPGTNGKINNLAGGVPRARHDVLVISDSDVRLTPGYLKAIVAPLAVPGVACACTPYKAAEADAWYEKIELLTLNADFVPNVIFASETGVSGFCLGASTALTRQTLEEIGGIESLATYLVEDYEMGRRISESGKRVVLVPYMIDTMVDLKSPKQCWTHIVYWDQNTRAANRSGFFWSVIIRAVPFALFYATLRLFDAAGWAILGAAVAIRLAASALTLGCLRDWEGLRALAWLPLRDLAGLASWLLAFTQRTTTWRGTDFTLTRDGRLVAKESAQT